MRRVSPSASSRPAVYLVGSHATGKTTVARWVRDNYDLPMIAEVARGVLAEMEAQLDQLRTDLGTVDRYQRQVFERQVAAEQAIDGPFVSDRAFCNLAYAAHHSSITAELFRDPTLARYMQSVRQGVVFFLRPHKDLVRADGVRAGLEWEEVVRIDGMVKLLLEMFDVPYIPVESLSMQERVRCVQRVMSLAGYGAPAEGRPGLATAAAEFDELRATNGNGASSNGSTTNGSSQPAVS